MFWARFNLGRHLRKPGTLAWIAGVTLIAALVRVFGGSTSGIANLVILYAVPLVGLSFGTSAMREEIEDQTLTYVFTRPVDRGWIYAARLLSAIGIASLVGLGGVAWSITAIGSGVATVAAAIGSAAAYTAFFGLCGALLKRPAAFGLIFAIAWETALGAVPGFLSLLTLRTHLRNLAGLRPSNALLARLWDPPHVAVSVLVIVGVAVVGIAVGAMLSRRREFVLTR
ncbi:MAG: hypothetical protein AAF721_30405 [Myxococcota bacterium]